MTYTPMKEYRKPNSNIIISNTLFKRQSNYTKGKRLDILLRVIVNYCQSMKKLKNLVESTKPDIVIGNESWLHKDIKSAEVFPSDFTCYIYDLKR